MKTALPEVLLTCFLLTLAGCAPKTAPGVVRGTTAGPQGVVGGSTTAGPQGSVTYFSWSGKPIFVIWSDATSTDSRTEQNNSLMKCSGGLTYRGKDARPDRRVAFSAEIQDDKGKLTINGESYDLAEGALFLVSGVGDDPQVKQLSRDLTKLKLGQNVILQPEDLAAFAKDEPEIAAFFAKTAKPK
jgi:hypothetical protein